MPSFNLVDEPWVPCIESAHAPPELLSLPEVFARAPQLWQIADRSPVVTVSIHRLLLAILHRSLDGPKDGQEWGQIWRERAWDLTAIDRYLTAWRERFDLFDERFPFYQTPDLDFSSAGPASQLTHERASDRNKPVLFDHTSKADGLAPAEAAGYLLAQQNFDVGGTKSYDRRSKKPEDRYAKASPLLKAAVCLIRGRNVFETLMLNWHQYDRESEIPFAMHGVDLPAWERAGGARPEERMPDGYVDLLTWQSRRIQLVPEVSAEGRLMVGQVILMKGYWFPDAFEQWRSETMAAFTRNTQAREGEAWSPLGLRIDRTVWRDSQALFRSIAGERERPRMFDWLANLMVQRWLDERQAHPLEVSGLISDQAKILDWRRETLPLPLALLREVEMVETIRQAVDLAEGAANLLHVRDVQLEVNGKSMKVASPMTELCMALLAGMSGRTPDRKACRSLADHFAAPQQYWATLDAPFRTLVNDLPRDETIDAYGNRRYGQQALLRWAGQVEDSVRHVFRSVVNDFDSSAKTLRAVALGERRFRFCLATLMAPYRPHVGAKGVSA